MGGRPKAPFYIALLLVVGGLVMFALNRSDWIAPKGVQEGQPVTTTQANPSPTSHKNKRQVKLPIRAASPR